MNFQLTTDEANLILHALGQLPFVQSAALINKLQTQAQEELKRESAEKE